MAKRFLLSFVSLAYFSCMAFAQKNYLCLYSKNQTDNRSWQINDVRKITFSLDAINVYLWEERESYDLFYNNFLKLTFEGEPISADVSKIELQTLAMTYNAVRKSLLIRGVTNNGLIQVYTLSGSLSIASVIYGSQTEFSLANLSKGLYIVKLSDSKDTKSIKIQIQ